MNIHGIIQERETSKGFIDSERFLHRSQYLKMIECKKVSALLPKRLKKTFNSGIYIPTKMRLCNERNDKRMCKNYKNLVNQSKKFETLIILSKKTTFH